MLKKVSGKLLLFIVFISVALIALLGYIELFYRVQKSSNTPRKFGATYMTMNNPYFSILNGGINEVVEANGDFLITRDPAQDQEKQNSQIYEMIEEGVAAIFLNPVDWKKVKPALIACKEAGIPVFNVDTMVYDKEYVVSIIASDNYNAGVQCALDMMSKLDSAEIVILDQPIINSITQRVQGFLDTIKGNDNYKVVVQKAAGGELEIAMEVMDDIIESGVSFNVVLGGNDPTALGALAALASHHMTGDILIYGIDGSPDGKMMIKEGYLEGTSAQYPHQMGKIAAEVAYAYLNGEEIERNIVVPVTLITKENLDEFSIDGWQ
ncbi:MAG TPA: sugar ABC transporter substrate-binding protein [Thermoclostridium caenicola]|uniref:sugar ABC transporter substrate-binding protein n=1 Tax=Thermoclostridium caenicola TaxID=659425 RepID=UPI002B8672C7|nr:sugar ABC transporter substrate-binding protein [Thermoclostridium caenicola]HOK43476.1 sugar ABC transporter substrate-binding protein [Thermoclostridium caenicola]HOL84124.1 sugar ABC transporter substrate-binding protein [Thermoclostridium caenicola]HPO76190.1 sugar ABC transporter substrate-binding protein [Thermoclostridium caenicola]HPU22079.1 sugar ABC transporter substrate-binding protein [Thermoclostridium caenicola]